MFGDLLRSARLEMGLTQGDLARLAGTSQPSVSDYEIGRVSPTVEVAQRLLAVLGQELATVPEWTPADRRSLEMARLHVRHLLDDPERVRTMARRNIKRMRELSRQMQPWVAAWEGLLQLPDNVLADLLVDGGEFARAMRSTSPFAGVLSEEERLAVIEAATSKVA